MEHRKGKAGKIHDRTPAHTDPLISPPQRQLDALASTRDGATLRRDTETCLDLFAQCLAKPRLSNAGYLWFEDCQARFRWWVFGLKASSSGRGSLNRTLANRQDIRDAISDLIRSISSALVACLGEPGLDPTDDDDEARSDVSSPSSYQVSFSEASINSDTDSDDYFAGISAHHAYLIDRGLRSLMRFSVLIRKSKNKLRHKQADDELAQIQRDTPQLYSGFKLHLETVLLFGPYEHSLCCWLDFAAAQGEILHGVAIVIRAWLSDRLGPIQKHLIQANIMRRHRIIHSRKDARSLNFMGSQANHPPFQQRTALPATTRPSSSRPAQGTRPVQVVGTYNTPSAAPTLSVGQEPPTHRTATAVSSEPGTLPIRSTKATSVVSRLTRTGQDQDYPKVSVLKKSPHCPYCGFVLDSGYVRDEKRWQ